MRETEHGHPADGQDEAKQGEEEEREVKHFSRGLGGILGLVRGPWLADVQVYCIVRSYAEILWCVCVCGVCVCTCARVIYCLI